MTKYNFYPLICQEIQVYWHNYNNYFIKTAMRIIVFKFFT